MFVVILSWNGGENDPFTPFNAAISSYLDACGKRTRILQLSDSAWPNQLFDLGFDGIDFVFTFQGLGTAVRMGEKQGNIWESLQVPLICYHGDHPSHMPAHHALDTPSSTHLYSTREFCLYANRHFRKRSRASVAHAPMLSQDIPLGERYGDYFVLAKNVTPPSDMEEQWRRELSERDFALYMAGAEELKSSLAQEPHVDVHAVLDDLLVSEGMEALNSAANPAAYHCFHSQLDFYVRNHTSVMVLEALKDVPLQIHGRGWSAYAKRGNPNHMFFRGRDMAHSQSLFYSNFGIVDVTPSRTGVHDRTLRAMRNETPFLSSAYLPEFLPDMDRYDTLFYGFSGEELREKCEAVMADPDTHAEQARAFSHQYQMRVHPHDFVRHLDTLARSMDRR